MTDNPETQAPLKKKPGWPAGKARKPKAMPAREAIVAAADRAEKPSYLAKMKHKPNWESEDYVGVGMDGVDRLKIPDDILFALQKDGVALQWVTKSVRGQETPQELSKMTKGGWTPVNQSDFDGLLDGMFMPKGQDDVITVDDCLLVARPTAIQRKAMQLISAEANRPLRVTEEQIGHGIPGVTGSSHKSVRNQIQKSFERIEIPEE